MYTAITRDISPAMAQCELTFLDRQPIDIALARAQHHRYAALLAEAGCQVKQLPAEPDLPDSVFVEDTALVFDELAIITRPGADSRRPETETIARALSPYRSLYYIETPATVDGGDVLRVGKHVYVGLSTRSNAEAIEQMRAILAPHGYTVAGIPLTGCLHLKSAITQVSERALLANPDWVDIRLFGDMTMIEVDPAEPHAANALLIGQTVIYPSAYPRTQKQLEAQGIAVKTVNISEMIKAEGAVTCCSLVFRA